MNEWITGKVKELIDINPDIKLYKGKNYPFISMDIITPYYKPVSAVEHREFKSGGSKFENGDTLFSRITPCLENGKTAKVKNLKENRGFGSTEFFVLRGKDGLTSDEFVYYLSISEDFRKRAERLMTGTSGRQRVDKKQFADMDITIPNFHEQEKIVSILKNLDDKIELNLQMNETLEEMAMTLYKHWFVDFGPFQDDEFVESELGMIPEGWEVKKVKDLGEVVTGKTPSTKEQSNYGNDIPFIKIPDMQNQVYVISTDTMLSKEGAETQKTKYLPKNSVCVSCIATPGVVSLTEKPSQTNQQINSIICNKGISPYFVYLYFRNISSNIVLLGSGGTATLNLNKGDFSNIKLVVPTESAISKFHLTIKNVFELIESNSKQTKYLESIRDYLLPKLLSGEIDLSDAEKEVEQVL